MIGIGVDLVDVERFRRVISRTPGIVSRLFRPSEREYAEKADDPAQRYAARFAVKEATLKSLGLGLGSGCGFAVRVRVRVRVMVYRWS